MTRLIKLLQWYWLLLLLPLLWLPAKTAWRYATMPHNRADWISREVAWLQRQQPTPAEIAHARLPCKEVWTGGGFFPVDAEPERRATWVYLDRRGLLRLPNGEWLVMVSHSFHDGEATPWDFVGGKIPGTLHLRSVMRRAWNPDLGVGDLTLVMTQDHQIYYHLGHVCGVLTFTFPGELRTTADFLQTVPLNGPPSTLTWQPLATLAP